MQLIVLSYSGNLLYIYTSSVILTYLNSYLHTTGKEYPNSTMASQVQMLLVLLNLHKPLPVLGTHPPRSARASSPSVSAGTSRGAEGQAAAGGHLLQLLQAPLRATAGVPTMSTPAAGCRGAPARGPPSPLPQQPPPPSAPPPPS